MCLYTTLQAIRQSIQDQLPPEPPENCKQPLSNIRLRCPGGEMFTRRFLATTRLQVLLNFVTVKGFDTANYKVLTTFPRRDVSSSECPNLFQHLAKTACIPFVNSCNAAELSQFSVYQAC